VTSAITDVASAASGMRIDITLTDADSYSATTSRIPLSRSNGFSSRHSTELFRTPQLLPRRRPIFTSGASRFRMRPQAAYLVTITEMGRWTLQTTCFGVMAGHFKMRSTPLARLMVPITLRGGLASAIHRERVPA
jgi:hypothetical protein